MATEGGTDDGTCVLKYYTFLLREDLFSRYFFRFLDVSFVYKRHPLIIFGSKSYSTNNLNGQRLYWIALFSGS